MTEQAAPQVKTVHVVFKTHLDVGFTDYARNVVDTYFQKFIPAALQTARALRDSDTPFRWTAGSWLIYEYLENAGPEQRHDMEDAIYHGDIAWHGLPFTTHTELMDPSLFRFGLRYAQLLDERYGRQTIAAKMTDVPGHTRGIIPLMHEAGIEFLHIGVNPASMPPDVPTMFVWKDEATDTQLTVMYHTIYGDISTIIGSDQAIAIVLTGDNVGPPSHEAIQSTYQNLRKLFPAAEVKASTLDAFAAAIRPITPQLPVITQEIGDTWIHGPGSDPTKIRQYRALLRLRNKWLAADHRDDARLETFSHALIMVPEHTWGMDEKTHLADYEHYTPHDLTTIRDSDVAQRFEASWTEQREYVSAAVAALEGSPMHKQAVAKLDKLVPVRPSLHHYTPVTGVIDTNYFEVGWDEASGKLTHLLLKDQQRQIADQDYEIGGFCYEVFSEADYERFWKQYIRESEEVLRWARDDYVKAGLPDYAYQCWQAKLTEAYQYRTSEATHLLFGLAMPDESLAYGAPRDVTVEYSFPAARPEVDIRVQWFDKAASRLPEALWFSFQPHVPEPAQWRLHKLGQYIEPTDVISLGARSLHAVQDGVFYMGEEAMQIITWDTPLVAVGQRSLLNFTNVLPNLNDGIHFNLYNNVWGTNFRMWFDEDALFRFTLRFER